MGEKYAVLIVRVSTLGQDYEPQINDLRKYAKSRGFTDFHIIETKESGLIDLEKRVGTNQLFSFISENPKYKVVFVTEISRLGRRQSILHQVKEWLVKNGIQLYVKDIGYSLLDENNKVSIGGDMMFSLYGLFAETEVTQKKERFSRSKKSLMEQGLSISGKTLFGYKRVSLPDLKRTTLVIEEENAEKVRIIFNWYNNGIDVYEKNVSIKRIALECRKLSFPKYTHSKRNVNKLLKEEGYTGEKITNNKRKNPNYQEEGTDEKYFITNNKIKYPTIIDKDTFELTQKRLRENNSRIDKSHKNITLLSKLIKCEKCDSHYTGNYRIVNERITNSYRCNSRSKSNPCENKQSISMSMLDSVVWGVIKSDLSTLSKVISKFNPDKEIILLKTSLKSLEKRNNEIDEEISVLNQSFKGFSKFKNVTSGDFINSIQSKVKKLDKEKGIIDNEISRIKVNLSVKNKNEDDQYESIINNLRTIEESKELLKKYINLFVDKVDILVHNSSYSVIRVKFKIDSHSFLLSKPTVYRTGLIQDGELEVYTNIILDKRHTLKVKSFKTTISIQKTNNEETIQLIDTKTPRKIKRTRVYLNDLENSKYKDYLKVFEFSKLKIYELKGE